MNRQICMDDLLKQEPEPVVIPGVRSQERAYAIPGDVWEGRCCFCIHKVGKENWPVPAWAVYRHQYDEIVPCRIMTVAQFDKKPGECMSFAPRMDTSGICETCKHNNIFHDGFCMKEDHAEQRRVFFGGTYGGDERKLDYYGRHRLSVCDDYEPDIYVKEGRY